MLTRYASSASVDRWTFTNGGYRMCSSVGRSKHRREEGRKDDATGKNGGARQDASWLAYASAVYLIDSVDLRSTQPMILHPITALFLRYGGTRLGLSSRCMLYGVLSSVRELGAQCTSAMSDCHISPTDKGNELVS